MGEPVDAAREVEWFRKFDQEARSILLSHYSSQRQHWGWSLVTLGVVFFAVSQGKGILFYGRLWAVRIAYGFIAACAVYALVKIYWLGGACSHILSASPSRASGMQNESYLAQIEQGSYDVVRSEPFGYFIFSLSSLKRSKTFLVLVTAFFSLLFSLPSILSSVLFLRILSRMKSLGGPWYRHIRLEPIIHALIGIFWLIIFLLVSITLVVYLFRLWKTSQRKSKDYKEQKKVNDEYSLRAGPETHRRWKTQWMEGYKKLQKE